MVEKTRPDGYRILNGHHRWAAALRAGVRRLPVKLLDLTQESDIQKMLRSSASSKRITLDLDEVVFPGEDDSCLEPPLPFPLNRIYRERLRRGIPALFHELNGWKYNIWIYTARYYSLEYLKHYFRHYRVHVTGIVTGTARKAPQGTNTLQALEKLSEAKYKTTVHVDGSLVLRTFKGSPEFDEHPLSGSAAGWSREVMEIIGGMNQHGKEDKLRKNAGVL